MMTQQIFVDDSLDNLSPTYDRRRRRDIFDKMSRRFNSERGVALILVTFVVALATIIVVNMTYSAHLHAFQHNMLLRGVQAEYLLKSAVNVARLIIQIDASPEDAPRDMWARCCTNGFPVPAEWLGISDPNVRIYIEIKADSSKLRLGEHLLKADNKVDEIRRDIFVRLFRELGFDEDGEKDHTGRFKDTVFNSEELVAMIIDYLDKDNESYNSGDFASGRESELPEDFFPNNGRLEKLEDLSTIPGFTPNRLRKLSPFVTTTGRSWVNINLAPAVVLRSLHDGIDENDVEQIIEFRNRDTEDDGPFIRKNQLRDIIGEDIYNEIQNLVDIRSGRFHVLGKVDYGDASYYIQASLSHDSEAELPFVEGIELY